MNNKILVEIYFPAVLMSFDVYIPEDVSFYRISGMLSTVSEKLTNGLFIPSEESVLCDGQSGAVIDAGQTARELCLHNGSRLMYI